MCLLNPIFQENFDWKFHDFSFVEKVQVHIKIKEVKTLIFGPWKPIQTASQIFAFVWYKNLSFHCFHFISQTFQIELE